MRVLFLAYAHERGLRADAGGHRERGALAGPLAARGHEVRVLSPRLPGHAPLRSVPCRAYPVLDARWLRPLTAYLAMSAGAWRLGRGWGPGGGYFPGGGHRAPPPGG